MVAAGVGITLMPKLAVAQDGLRLPSLALRRFQDPEPARTIAAAWRPGCAREETIARLSDAIAELMR
jgi:LysR family transcriptional regulator, hydrogen peroxide-inducible genes activator